MTPEERREFVQMPSALLVSYCFQREKWLRTGIMVCTAMPVAPGVHLLNNVWVMGGLLPV